MFQWKKITFQPKGEPFIELTRYRMFLCSSRKRTGQLCYPSDSSCSSIYNHKLPNEERPLDRKKHEGLSMHSPSLNSSCNYRTYITPSRSHLSDSSDFIYSQWIASLPFFNNGSLLVCRSSCGNHILIATPWKTGWNNNNVRRPFALNDLMKALHLSNDEASEEKIYFLQTKSNETLQELLFPSW